jgi:hypothetical protein
MAGAVAKRVIYRIGADAIFLVHFLVIAIALFGWLVPSWWHVYMAVLVGILLSELFLSYCVLSKWEFDLRKKMNPRLNYEHSYTTYYTYKLTGRYLGERFLARLGIVFTSLSIAINLYFRFLF